MLLQASQILEKSRELNKYLFGYPFKCDIYRRRETRVARAVYVSLNTVQPILLKTQEIYDRVGGTV